MSKLPSYPYRHKDTVARRGDLIVVRNENLGHLCGYCAFRDEELPVALRGNYDAPGLQFLAIHGGPTYAESSDGYSVFGFDCMHAGDDEKPELRDPGHVLKLAEQMREQIAAFAARHEEWQAADREGRCAILDEIRAEATIPTEFGLGGMIGILCGAPELGQSETVA
jgi:hypothetical protein